MREATEEDHMPGLRMARAASATMFVFDEAAFMSKETLDEFVQAFGVREAEFLLLNGLNPEPRGLILKMLAEDQNG
jgi:hypothetical protein